jgi:hypothetical protein
MITPLCARLFLATFWLRLALMQARGLPRELLLPSMAGHQHHGGRRRASRSAPDRKAPERELTRRIASRTLEAVERLILNMSIITVPVLFKGKTTPLAMKAFGVVGEIAAATSKSGTASGSTGHRSPDLAGRICGHRRNPCRPASADSKGDVLRGVQGDVVVDHLLRSRF